jgi:tetratricopeptide (TPR) repeat protein
MGQTAMKLKRQFFRPGRRIEQIGKLAAHPFFTRGKKKSRADDSGDRGAPYASRAPWLARVAENFGALFSIAISAVLIAAIAALLYAFAREIQRDEMELAAFTAPKELVDRGYASNVIAEHILEEVRTIQNQSRTCRECRKVGSDNALPDIQVAGSGVSMKSIVRYARHLFGLPDNRIDGEILQDGPTLRLNMRLSEHGRTQALAVRRDDGSVENLLKDAGREITRMVDPFTLAAWYKQREAASKNYAQTLAVIDYVLTHPPASDDAWANDLLGVVLRDEGRNAEALEAFQRAVALDADLADARQNLVLQLVIMDRLPEAVAHVDAQTARARSGRDWRTVFNMNHTLGRWDVLFDSAKRILAMEPKGVGAHIRAAHALIHRHRPREALAVAERGLVLGPGNVELLNFRAESLIELGRGPEALDAGNATLAAGGASEGDTWAGLISNRARAYLVLGRREDAWADYLRVAKDKTINLDIDWGEVLLGLGRPKDALPIYAARLHDDPRYWPAHVGMARANLALGNAEEAVRRFEFAAKGDPDDPALYRDWAKALEALGRGSDASAKRADAAKAEARLGIPLRLN